MTGGRHDDETAAREILGGARRRGMPPPVGRGCIGRVGFQADGVLHVLPVNYAVDADGTVVFRTTGDGVLAGLAGRQAVFEVDGFDPTSRSGWSVCVRAWAETSPPADSAAVQHLLDLAVIPWAPGERDRWFAITPEEVSGRRIPIVRAPPTSAGSLEWCRDRCPDRAGQCRSGARPHRPGRRPDRPAGQRRAGRRCSTRSKRAAERLDGVRVHQMHALHDRRYLHGEFGDHLRHISYFLSDVTRPCFRAGTVDLVPNHFSEMRTLLRDRTRRPARPGGGIAARSPRVLQPRAQRRLRRVVHRAGPVLPRGQPRACRARSAATRSTSARSSAGREVGRPARRGAPGADRRAAIARIAGVRRRADRRRRHHPGRHRLDPQRHPVGALATTATSASTPS